MESQKRPLDNSTSEDAIAIAKRQALERAKSIAAKIAQNAASSSTTGSFTASLANPACATKVFIPQNHSSGINFVGLIIGPKAKTLRELQMKSGCHLEIRGRGMNKTGVEGVHSDEEQHVHITGSSQQLVDSAAVMINEIFTNPDRAQELKRSQLPEMENRTSGFTRIVQVPNDLAGAVIGRGGEQIKQFIAQSGAHIQIDNSPENMSKPMRDLTVQGDGEQIAKAERMISDFIQSKREAQQGQGGGGSNPNSALNYPVKIRLEVPDNKVGLIIGKQGKTIHRIQGAFRCKIDIPPTHDEGNPHVRTLTVGAHSDAELESAKNDIFSVITYGVPGSTPYGGMQQQHTQQSQNVAGYANMGATAGGYGYGGQQQVQYQQQQQQQQQGYYQQDQRDASNVSNAGNGANGEASGEGEEKQVYTKEQWLQWRQYYLANGKPDIGEDAPLELRAENY